MNEIVRSETGITIAPQGIIATVDPEDITYCDECARPHVLIAPIARSGSRRETVSVFIALLKHLREHLGDTYR